MIILSATTLISFHCSLILQRMEYISSTLFSDNCENNFDQFFDHSRPFWSKSEWFLFLFNVLCIYIKPGTFDAKIFKPNAHWHPSWPMYFLPMAVFQFHQKPMSFKLMGKKKKPFEDGTNGTKCNWQNIGRTLPTLPQTKVGNNNWCWCFCYWILCAIGNQISQA